MKLINYITGRNRSKSIKSSKESIFERMLRDATELDTLVKESQDQVVKNNEIIGELVEENKKLAIEKSSMEEAARKIKAVFNSN